MARVTLKQIADTVGLSTFAVSRALAGKDGVSPATRRLVSGDWSILWLRKRPAAATHASRMGALPEWSRKW